MNTKNRSVLTLLILSILVISVSIPLCAAASLTKPSVSLPNNWELYDEIDYPETQSEHDEEGAGLVEYENKETYDYVMIYYEKAPTTTYTSDSLKAEAVEIFNCDHTDKTVTESGTKTVAGAQAGFARSYSSTYDTYYEELVFVKGNYYINAYAVYYSDNENDVYSLLNSINTDNSLNLLIIIGVIVAIIVVVIVIIFVMRKKKNLPQMQQQVMPESYPPPPPPT